MTLLICGASARPETPEGARLAELFAALQARYPLAFIVIATREPPDQPALSAQCDWLTLPAASQLVWQDADRCAAQMLLAYAQHLKPCATVLVGTEAAHLHATCLRVGGAAASFGEVMDLTVSSSDSALFQTLDRVLPVAMVIDNQTSLAQLTQTLRSQQTRPEIRLYWAGQLTSRCAQLALAAGDLTSGAVRVQVRLRDALKRRPRGLRALFSTSRRAESQVRVAFVAEEGIPLRSSSTLTRIFAGGEEG